MSKKRLLLLTAGLLLFIVVGTAVLAQTSTNFNLEWHVIGGGGQPAASTNYRVNGTVGQGFAGPPAQSGSQAQLTSGYWVVGVEQYIFLPTVLR